jgi:SAM-dependent methyltransferase
MNRVLHVGCGSKTVVGNFVLFPHGEWSETRLDVDPGASPDIVASMVDMSAIADESYDAIYSAHSLEHLFRHELRLALAEWHRVLRPGGAAVAVVPDIQAAAAAIAAGTPTKTLYVGPSGPITAMDMVYGWGEALDDGKVLMAHRNGFVSSSLIEALDEAGFAESQAVRREFDLYGLGYKEPVPANTARLQPPRT